MRRRGTCANRRGSLRGFVRALPPSTWTPADLSDRILHLDAGLGVTTSGSSVTAWADQSPAAETITITDTPTYSASDANLNSQPSIALNSADKIEALGVLRGDVQFAAGVFYVPSTSVAYAWDASIASGGRLYTYLNANVTAFVPSTTTTLATGIYSGGGKRRLIVPMDGTTASVIDGATQGTATANGIAVAAGMSIASNITPGAWSTVAEVVFCSTVPSAQEIIDLNAYYAVKYGS